MTTRTTTKEEGDTIAAIAARYWLACIDQGQMPLGSRHTVAMDIEAVHLNCYPLSLDALLVASLPDLMHDVRGIILHTDRETGRLYGFVPRFAQE